VTRVPAEVSVTVAVHVVAEFNATEAGAQLTAVEVARCWTTRVNVAVTPLGVPVTVTVKVPDVAVALADKVNVETAPGEGAGVTAFRVAGVEVTPVGRPDRARLTL
jgi:hypothetical protein